MSSPLARFGSAAALSAVTALTAAPVCAADAAPDVFGTFWVTRYDAKIEVLGGGDLPLTPEGKAAYETNIAGLKDGSITDASRRWCVPGGLPRVLANPYPFEIFNAPRGQVTFVYELSHMVRPIQMDQPLPSDKELIPYPYFNGHSVGRFDGDALVIEFRRLQRADLHRRHRRAPYRLDAYDRAHPPDQPDPDRGRRHHPRSGILHPRLAGALRLPAAR